MSSLTPDVMLTCAAGYAQRHWPIFPLQPQGKSPLFPRCRALGTTKSGKPVPHHPSDCGYSGVGHGHHDATTDLEVIRSWWSSRPDANIGLACTAAGGRLVIDVDGPEAGEELKALQRRHGALPQTLSAKTARGWHLHYHHPGGDLHGKLADGLDIKGGGKGGYVVLPPSLHPSGTRYRWHRWPHEVADLPGWVMAMLRKQPRRVPFHPSSKRMTPKRLEALLAVVRGAVEGGRNKALYWTACRLAEAGASDEQVGLLYRAGTEVGLDDDEVARAIDNAMGAAGALR